MKLITTKSIGNSDHHFVTTYRVNRIVPGNLSSYYLKVFAVEKFSVEHLDFFIKDHIDPKLKSTDIMAVRHVLEIYYFDYTNKNHKTTNYVLRWPITLLNSDLVSNVARAITMSGKVLYDIKDKKGLADKIDLQADRFLKIYESVFTLEDFRLDKIKLYRSFAFSEDQLEHIFPSVSELSVMDSNSDSE